MGGRENRRGFFVAKSDQVVLPIELAPDDVLRVLLPQSANVRLADVGVVFDSLRVLWVLGQVNVESALSVLGRKSIVITSLCRKKSKRKCMRSPIRRPNAKEALFIITLKFYHQTNIYKKNKTEKGRGQRRNEREREREREYVFSRAFYTKACF